MKRLLSVIALFAFTVSAYAQYPGAGVSAITGKISGTVVDSVTKKPLDYATVSIFRGAAKTPINGVLTDDKGSFRLNNINPGSYSITITYLGYPSKTISNIKTTPEKPDNNLGAIVLAPGAKALQAVTVSGQAAIIENRVDKVVYNAEKDNTIAGGNAGDVLRKVPMVSVDQDGNVSLRGSQGVKILINGRPSGAMAGSVGDAMKMLPADQIKSVEVITSPSAKYDAEGAAGIINIITKKKNSSGVSGSLSGGLGTRQNNGNANLNVNHNRLSISGNAGGNLTWPQTSRTSFSSNNLNDNSTRTQTGTSETKRYAMVGSGNVAYDFNNFNSLSSGIRFNQGQFETDGLTNVSSIAGSVTDTYTQKTYSKTKFGGFDWNADFTHKFKQEGQEITFAGQWSHAKNPNDFSALYTPSSVQHKNQKGNNKAKNDEYTVQLDYTMPLSKMLKLETGAKSISRGISSIYDIFQQTTGDNYITDALRSNDYDYQQDVYSGYAVFSMQFKNNLGMQLGSRVENTQISGDAIRTNPNLQPFSNSYTNYIPSVAISKTFKGTKTLRLSYSKRIQRPSLAYLNPFRNTANLQNQSVGNPSLSPEVSQSIELNFSTYVKTSVVNASVFYRHTDDIIESTVSGDTYTITSENGTSTVIPISLTTYNNIGRNNSFGGSFFGQIKPIEKLTLRTSISAFSYKPTTSNAFQNLSNSNTGTYLMYNAFAQATLTLPHGFTTETYMLFNSPRRTFQGRNPSFNIWVLSFNKEILNKKGKIGLNVIDPFNEYKNFNSRITSSSLVQENKFALPFRSFGVNFSWSFGKMNFNPQPKKKRGVNNDDLKQDSDQSGGQQGQGAPARQ